MTQIRILFFQLAFTMLIFFFSSPSFAQQKKSIRFELVDSGNIETFNELLHDFDLSKTYNDTVAIQKDLNLFLSKVHSHGYLSAS